MASAPPSPFINTRSAMWLAGLAGLAALAIWMVERSVRLTAVAEAQTIAQSDAAILSLGLQSELDKFTLVPLVLAQDPQVAGFLAGETDQRQAMNVRLATLARQTNAAAIYLMRADGETLAASNWQLPTSFVGSNYAFRGYFQRAMDQGSATQFALGTVSRRPGLYVAQRVGPAHAPVGMVALKVEFDGLEASWREATQGVYVTDKDGIVLLASQDEWRFRAANPTAMANRDQEADQQQFGISSLQLLAIASGAGMGDAVGSPLLDTQQPIALDGWELHLLVDPSPQVEAAIANGRLMLVFVLAVIAALIALALYLRRQRKLAEDAVVNEKTRTLREQLTQANRLATLGQITAGVGHEISQPIAAARVFAENGEKLLAGGKTQAAAANFAQIAGLTDRMGRITDELRRFSRRRVSEPKAMPVDQAIDGALLLLRDRITSLDIDLGLPASSQTDIMVQAEHVQLEQVLVNLLQNAVDATGPGGQITIALSHDEKSCALSVADNGPGIEPSQVDQMFHPFATTKENGLGLGLVISRDIMRDLGGDLTFTSSVNGTRFTMQIPRA